MFLLPDTTYVLGFVVSMWWLYLSDTLLQVPETASVASLSTLTPHLNVLLLNNLNRYHPVVLYWTFATLFTTVGWWWGCRFRGHASGGSAHLVNFLDYLHSSIFCCGLLALVGGAWWALQEGTWGGWWNWDASEVFGLLPPVLALSAYHEKLSVRRWIKHGKRSESLALLTLASYFIIQLNFENASHNFGVHLFFFFTNDALFSNVLWAVIGLGCGVLWRGGVVSSFYTTASFKVVLTERMQVLSQRKIQYMTLSLFLLPPLLVIAGTGCVALLPTVQWVGLSTTHFFLKLNLWFLFSLLVFYKLLPPSVTQPLTWLHLTQFWQWTFTLSTRPSRPNPHLFIHTTLLFFFSLNTVLFDTLIITSQVRSGGFNETPIVTFEGFYRYWALQHDLVGTEMIVVGEEPSGLVGSTTTSFQTTSWTPINYSLVMSNLNQTNFYLLTDLTRGLFVEVEATYLLWHLVTIPLLFVLVLRCGWRY